MTLKLTDEVDLAEINSAQDCIAAAADPEVVSLFEEVVNQWCKQVAQVPSFWYLLWGSQSTWKTLKKIHFCSNEIHLRSESKKSL